MGNTCSGNWCETPQDHSWCCCFCFGVDHVTNNNRTYVEQMEETDEEIFHSCMKQIEAILSVEFKKDAKTNSFSISSFLSWLVESSKGREWFTQQLERKQKRTLYYNLSMMVRLAYFMFDIPIKERIVLTLLYGVSIAAQDEVMSSYQFTKWDRHYFKLIMATYFGSREEQQKTTSRDQITLKQSTQKLINLLTTSSLWSADHLAEEQQKQRELEQQEIFEIQACQYIDALSPDATFLWFKDVVLKKEEKTQKKLDSLFFCLLQILTEYQEDYLFNALVTTPSTSSVHAKIRMLKFIPPTRTTHYRITMIQKWIPLLCGMAFWSMLKSSLFDLEPISSSLQSPSGPKRQLITLQDDADEDESLIQ